jgi:NADH:ubiquinone oxidoreductase subunit 5 (subunit L)/multisubunit Na+/H+ antiporter MnhA subunit
VLHQFCSTLLIRISPILEFSGSVLLIITLIGSSTAFFAATCGLLQNDLKRIIAFSTISQLGYILLLILLLFLIYNILYLEDIQISIFSNSTLRSSAAPLLLLRKSCSCSCSWLTPAAAAAAAAALLRSSAAAKAKAGLH